MSALERLRALAWRGIRGHHPVRTVERQLRDRHRLRTDVSATPVRMEYECNNVGPDYFRTIGIPILRGREFTAADQRDSQPVVIVSETFARAVFGNTDPVGHTITTGLPHEKSKLIVGVAKDSKYFTLGESNVWPCTSRILPTTSQSICTS